jgi:hypothetical protein
LFNKVYFNCIKNNNFSTREEWYTKLPALQQQINKKTTLNSAISNRITGKAWQSSELSLFIYNKVPVECPKKMGLNSIVLT